MLIFARLILVHNKLLNRILLLRVPLQRFQEPHGVDLSYEHFLLALPLLHCLIVAVSEDRQIVQDLREEGMGVCSFVVRQGTRITATGLPIHQPNELVRSYQLVLELAKYLLDSELWAAIPLDQQLLKDSQKLVYV